MTAVPCEHFAIPPYRAELISESTGWAGVMNANGFNCLRFTDKPGAIITTLEEAKRIAAQWNGVS